MMKKFLIVNPHSGNGKCQKIWPKIKSELFKHNFDFDFELTKKKFDGFNITTKALNSGFRELIVVGGDGTFNEALNAVFESDSDIINSVRLGIIPVGTGNDWCRTFKIPRDYKKAIEILKKDSIKNQDIGLVTYSTNGERKSRYFLNVAGFGFDAHVAQRVNIDKDNNRSGIHIYIKDLLKSMFEFSPKSCEITIGNENFNTKLLSGSVGIGKFNGGGMKQLPNADPYDGLFDVTLIGNLSKLQILKNVPGLFTGGFLKHPKVSSYKTEYVLIDSKYDILIETDGEVLGNQPFEFKIIPKAIYVYAP